MFDFKRLVVGDELKLGRLVYSVRQIRPTPDGAEAVLFRSGSLCCRVLRVSGALWEIADHRGAVICKGVTP